MFFLIFSRYATENLLAQKLFHSSFIAGIVTTSQSFSFDKIYHTKSSSRHLCIMIHIPAFSLCLRDKKVESYQSCTFFLIVSLSASCRVAYGSSIMSLCHPLPVIPHQTPYIINLFPLSIDQSLTHPLSSFILLLNSVFHSNQFILSRMLLENHSSNQTLCPV